MSDRTEKPDLEASSPAVEDDEREAEAAAPPELVDVLLTETIRRVNRDGAHGGRIPISAVRRALGALSSAAVDAALRQAERRGVLWLVPNQAPTPEDEEHGFSSRANPRQSSPQSR